MVIIPVKYPLLVLLMLTALALLAMLVLPPNKSAWNASLTLIAVALLLPVPLTCNNAWNVSGMINALARLPLTELPWYVASAIPALVELVQLEPLV